MAQLVERPTMHAQMAGGPRWRVSRVACMLMAHIAGPAKELLLGIGSMLS